MESIIIVVLTAVCAIGLYISFINLYEIYTYKESNNMDDEYIRLSKPAFLILFICSIIGLILMTTAINCLL